MIRTARVATTIVSSRASCACGGDALRAAASKTIVAVGSANRLRLIVLFVSTIKFVGLLHEPAAALTPDLN